MRAFETAGREYCNERDRAYLAADVDALAADVERFEPMHRGVERLERALSLTTDRGRFPSLPVLQRIGEFARAYAYRLLEAQALRAHGVATGDAAVLVRARELFDQAGARPYAARASCERALLTEDRDALTAGTRTLEGLGDVDYLSRMERLTRRRF
jgi:hypothetical protein